jgi:hypothetical protein
MTPPDIAELAIQTSAALEAHIAGCARSWELLNQSNEERHRAYSERIDRLDRTTLARLDKIESTLERLFIGMMTVMTSAIGALIWALAHQAGVV